MIAADGGVSNCSKNACGSGSNKIAANWAIAQRQQRAGQND